MKHNTGVRFITRAPVFNRFIIHRPTLKGSDNENVPTNVPTSVPATSKNVTSNVTSNLENVTYEPKNVTYKPKNVTYEPKNVTSIEENVTYEDKKVTSTVTSIDKIVTSYDDLGKTELAVLKILMKKERLSREEISDMLCKTVRTVQRALNSLRDKGYIERVGAKQYLTWRIVQQTSKK